MKKIATRFVIPVVMVTCLGVGSELNAMGGVKGIADGVRNTRLWQGLAWVEGLPYQIWEKGQETLAKGLTKVCGTHKATVVERIDENTEIPNLTVRKAATLGAALMLSPKIWSLATECALALKTNTNVAGLAACGAQAGDFGKALVVFAPDTFSALMTAVTGLIPPALMPVIGVAGAWYISKYLVTFVLTHMNKDAKAKTA